MLYCILLKQNHHRPYIKKCRPPYSLLGLQQPLLSYGEVHTLGEPQQIVIFAQFLF